MVARTSLVRRIWRRFQAVFHKFTCRRAFLWPCERLVDSVGNHLTNMRVTSRVHRNSPADSTEDPIRFDDVSLERYDSDKVAGYYEIYRHFLESFRGRRMRLLELGIHRGGSLLFWRDYLPLATIVGIDISVPKKIIRQFSDDDRIHCFEGDQTDLRFLSRVASETAESGYDVIVDDASHLGYETKVSFWHLFDHHLKSGGLYFIEDWGTGYWDDYPDGKIVDLEAYHRTPSSLTSHTDGMVGFIKQLIDEQGAADATRKRFHSISERKSKFRSMTIFPAVVVVEKA